MFKILIGGKLRGNIIRAIRRFENENGLRHGFINSRIIGRGKQAERMQIRLRMLAQLRKPFAQLEN